MTLRGDTFAFLRALTAQPSQLLTYREIHADLAKAGALPPLGEGESRTLVQTIAFDLRRAFHQLDPAFDALVYHPGVGFSWQE